MTAPGGKSISTNDILFGRLQKIVKGRKRKPISQKPEELYLVLGGTTKIDIIFISSGFFILPI